MLIRLMIAAILLSIAGCSSRTEAPKVSQTGKVPANPVAPAPDKPAIQNAPPDAIAEQPPRSPYEGLEAKQVALYEKVQGLLEPVGRLASGGYQGLKAEEHRAKAIIRFGRFNVSLNPKAEKGIRSMVAEVTDVSTQGAEYTHRAESHAAMSFPFTDVGSRDFLKTTYEKALDDGVEFPPAIRRSLGTVARSSGPQLDGYGIDLEALTADLRIKLVEQTVTGEYLYQLALAVRERAEAVRQCREWLRTVHALVQALPVAQRTDVLKRMAWDDAKATDLDKQRGALRYSLTDNPKNIFDTGIRRYVGTEEELTAKARELRSSYLAIEQKRRDVIEGYLRDFDVAAWQLLLKHDELLTKLQTILDAVVPDPEYRFRPLIPHDAPRGVEENVLPRLSIQGSVNDRIPTIDVVENSLVFDSPVGMPRFSEVFKVGLVLVGRVEDTEGVELVIQKIETPLYRGAGGSDVPGDQQLTCELRVPKTEFEESATLPMRGSIRGNVVVFSCREMAKKGPIFKDATFKGTTDKGPFSGTLTYYRGGGTFSFSPKK